VPLRLRVAADGFGRLLGWELPLHVDGRTVTVEAPEVSTTPITSAFVGPTMVSVDVRDDGQVASVAVFLNGDKVLWDPGGSARVQLRPELDLVEGQNRLMVRA